MSRRPFTDSSTHSAPCGNVSPGDEAEGNEIAPPSVGARGEFPYRQRRE